MGVVTVRPDLNRLLGTGSQLTGGVTMVIECCWCNTVTGEKDGGAGVTSTICLPCVGKYFPKHVAEFKRLRREARV